jgi:hypothetical protein
MLYNTNDTDSSTSTASPANENFDDKYEGQLYPILGSTIKMVSTNSNQDIELIDDFEICLLRILHIIFSVDGVMDLTKLSSFMDVDKNECEDLYEFFMENRGVMIESEYYRTTAGIELRKSWIELLSKREFFTYIQDKYKLSCDINNFYMFIKYFLPKVEFNLDLIDQDKLSQIYKILDININVIVGVYQNINEQFIHKGFIQNFTINNKEIYIWELSKVIQISEDEIIMISCDSELRFF